ncbi:MAG: hypothetical protein ACLQBX_05085 [Candidatus Limnocylindrales bacterium]
MTTRVDKAHEAEPIPPVEAAVRAILSEIGENPARAGLVGTCH